MLKNGPNIKLYRKHEMLRYFILSQRAGIAAYISSGEEAKGNNMEDKRRQMRTELRIRLID